MRKRIETKIKSLSKDFGIDLQVVEHNGKYEMHKASCVLINDISEGEVFAYLCGMSFALKHLNKQTENTINVTNNHEKEEQTKK